MKVLKSHEFTRAARATKHDWTTLLDGQTRQLDASDIGDAKPSTFGSQARLQANKRGMGVHLQETEDGGIILQAYERTAEDVARLEARREARANGKPAKKGKKS